MRFFWQSFFVLFAFASVGCFTEYGDGISRGPILPRQGHQACGFNPGENTCEQGWTCHRLYGAELFPNAGVCSLPCSSQDACNDFSDDVYGDFSTHACVAGRCLGPQNPGHPSYSDVSLDGGVDAGPDPDAVAILRFSPTQDTVAANQAISFVVETVNATSCVLAGFGNVAVNDTATIPGITETTAFELTCTGLPGDTQSAQAVVAVGDVVQIVLFDAEKPVVEANESFALSYTVIHAESCSLDDGSGDDPVSISVAGPVNLSITATTTFTLECIGIGGSANVSLDVSVATVDSWSLVSAVVADDEEFSLSWQAPHTRSCRVMVGNTEIVSGTSSAIGVGSVLFTLAAGSHSLSLSCVYDDEGGEISSAQSQSVSVMKIDSFALSEVPPLAALSTAHFVWETTAVDECALFSPDNVVIPLLDGLPTSCSQDLCGAAQVGANSGNYTLRCTKTIGGDVGQVQAQLPVAIAVEIDSFDVVIATGGVSFSWQSRAAESCAIDQGVLSGGAISDSVFLTDPMTTGPVIYTLLCTGQGMANSQSSTVTVWWGDYTESNIGATANVVVGDVNIDGQAVLHLDGATSFNEVGGNFKISDTRVSGFVGDLNLTTIHGNVSITLNPNLSCSECETLCLNLSMVGDFTCSSNKSACTYVCP
ncbi:MAG: hypothetical protein GY822_17330 [Deltaproteobacteria bacterium]|nr:hypothetical protein [Deltaproteobacteria bacterium]